MSNKIFNYRFLLLFILFYYYIMDYHENFQKLLKQMNKNKIDWDKKQSWETDIEQNVNKIFFVDTINEYFFNTSETTINNNIENNLDIETETASINHV